MQNQNHIALLIDADNTPYSKLADIMARYGCISVKRAYGNWSKQQLKYWEPTLRHHGIRAIQQFDCAVGKNATDIALCVDAMELLGTHLYDTFIIVSSDSDYTPLILKLRESTVRVIGVGYDTAPEAYRSACDEFLLLDTFDSEDSDDFSGLIDDLDLPEEEFTLEELTLDSPASEAESESVFDSLPEDFIWDSLSTPEDREIVWESFEFEQEPLSGKTEEAPKMQSVHKLLEVVHAYCKDEQGFALLSAAGNLIRETHPDFNYRAFGYKNLHLLLSAYPDRYQIIHYPTKGSTTVMAYRCCT